MENTMFESAEKYLEQLLLRLRDENANIPTLNSAIGTNSEMQNRNQSINTIESVVVKAVEDAQVQLKAFLEPEQKLRKEIKNLTATLADLEKESEAQQKQLKLLYNKSEKAKLNDQKNSKKKIVLRAHKILTGAVLLVDEPATGYIKQGTNEMPFRFPDTLPDEEVTNEVWKLYDTSKYNV